MRNIQLYPTKAMLLAAAIASAPILVSAQDAWTASGEPMVYPAKGQSAEQMSKDRYECHLWAVQQSGYDPSTAQAPSSGGSGKTGSAGREAVRGGARGAAAGAAIGAIAGDAGTGAAIGATAGALKRGAQQRRSNAEATSAADQGMSNYQRAQAVCLEGRGYSVK